MVSFDHRDAGTDERAWAEAGVADLPELTPPPWTPDTLLLVAVAHPDDETLGAAGMIRAALRGGARAHVLVATAGEASHPDSPTHTPERLVELRRAEMDHAMAALAAGIDAPERLRDIGASDASGVPATDPSVRLTWSSLALPDGGLGDHRDAVRHGVVRALEDHARAAGEDAPAVLVSHEPHDGHGDHEAVGAVVARVAGERDLPLYAFPLWFWHWGDPADLPSRRLRRLPLGPGDADARRAALDAHASQVRPLSDAPGDEAILPERMLAHFRRDFDSYRYSGPDDADAHRASAVFDRLYREHEDPWRYLTSPYEARKRDLTLAMLSRPRYGTVVEAGASIGVLTARLAERADAVIGLEASEVAVARAAERLAGVPHAEVRHAVLPQDWPAELGGGAAGEDGAPTPDVDLVVASEIGYFLQPEELDALLDHADAALGLGGELLLCHWRHPIQGWPLDGDAVHVRVASDPRWRALAEHLEEDVRITLHARAAVATHAVAVVPAKDEEELLPACLAALSGALDRWEAQHAQGSAAAVVVVQADDAPTLAAARAARRADARIHVFELGAPGPEDDGAGVGRARRAAARRARELFGDVPADRLWLASTDADTLVPADWLVAQAVLAARRREDGEALVLGTVDLGDTDRDETGDAVAGTVESAWRAEYRHEEGHPHVHGANLGLPWSLYERAGGWPAVAEHEDVRLSEAVREVGGDRVVATDRTRVLTSARLEGRTPGGFAGALRDLRAG